MSRHRCIVRTTFHHPAGGWRKRKRVGKGGSAEQTPRIRSDFRRVSIRSVRGVVPPAGRVDREGAIRQARGRRGSVRATTHAPGNTETENGAGRRNSSPYKPGPLRSLLIRPGDAFSSDAVLERGAPSLSPDGSSALLSLFTLSCGCDDLVRACRGARRASRVGPRAGDALREPSRGAVGASGCARHAAPWNGARRSVEPLMRARARRVDDQGDDEHDRRAVDVRTVRGARGGDAQAPGRGRGKPDPGDRRAGGGLAGGRDGRLRRHPRRRARDARARRRRAASGSTCFPRSTVSSRDSMLPPRSTSAACACSTARRRCSPPTTSC